MAGGMEGGSPGSYVFDVFVEIMRVELINLLAVDLSRVESILVVQSSVGSCVGCGGCVLFIGIVVGCWGDLISEANATLTSNEAESSSTLTPALVPTLAATLAAALAAAVTSAVTSELAALVHEGALDVGIAIGSFECAVEEEVANVRVAIGSFDAWRMGISDGGLSFVLSGLALVSYCSMLGALESAVSSTLWPAFHLTYGSASRSGFILTF